jgi:proteasome lid subunit RPN8/RPN11
MEAFERFRLPGSTSALIETYRVKPLPVDRSLSGETLRLTQGVISAIDRCLPKTASGQGHENVLYIAGQIDEETRTGVSVILPLAETGPGHFRTSIESHSAVLRELARMGLALVAQVHSHPGAAVTHSDLDDDGTIIKGKGFWSIVVPYYGRRGFEPIERCGFHCFQSGVFQVLSREAVSSRVRVIPNVLDLRQRG